MLCATQAPLPTDMGRQPERRPSVWLPGGGTHAAQPAADDPDALDDPPEVRELMEELGEAPRGRGAGAAGGPFGGFLPRGPLGAVSTLATGVVALTSEALVRVGDLADRLLFSTPLGESPR